MRICNACRDLPPWDRACALQYTLGLTWEWRFAAGWAGLDLGISSYLLAFTSSATIHHFSQMVGATCESQRCNFVRVKHKLRESQTLACEVDTCHTSMHKRCAHHGLNKSELPRRLKLSWIKNLKIRCASAVNEAKKVSFFILAFLCQQQSYYIFSNFLITDYHAAIHYPSCIEVPS